VRSSRKRDEHIETQVAKFLRVKPFLRTHLAQQLCRLQPIPCRGRKDGMIPLQGPQKFRLRRLSGITLQVAPGPQILNKDCCVKDDEVTHRTR